MSINLGQLKDLGKKSLMTGQLSSAKKLSNFLITSNIDKLSIDRRKSLDATQEQFEVKQKSKFKKISG